MKKLFNLRHFIVFAFLGIQTSFVFAAQPENCSGKDCSQNSTTSSGQPGQQQGAQALVPNTGTNSNTTNTNGTTTTTNTTNQNTVVVPTLIKSENEVDEAIAAVIAADHIEEAPNALDIIRMKLAEQAQLEQQKSQEAGWLSNTKKSIQPMHFTTESLTFFIAVGGVTFNSMWIKSHGDPLAMERHILSLKDPIAHLSFYSFMVANGFYLDLRTKNMDLRTKQQMLKRLSYQGMAIGSLASSLMSDLGQSAKMCVDSWILGKTDEKSIQSCNEAWKHWTVRNKFTQYFPQIIAMWISQAATEVIDSYSRKAFQKVSISSFAQKILNKDFLIKQAYKITGADVALTAVGGGWAIKSIKWIGKLTSISLFVGVDHFLSPYTYRPINNLLKPLLFDFDSLAINQNWAAADKINWDDNRIKEATSSICTNRNPYCFQNSFEKEIENFSTQMQQWREHLNSDAETDIAGWMEITKKLLNQIDYSYQFYKSFVGNFFQTLNVGSRIKSKELDPSAASVISRFPYRTLPFYGVATGAYKPIGGNVEDLYLLGTSELEKVQKIHILNVSKQFKQAAEYLKDKSLVKYNAILEKLLSEDTDKMALALSEINQLVSITPLANRENNSALYSAELKQVLMLFRKALGNPLPVVYPLAGFSQAFAANGPYRVTAEEADFSLWSSNQKYKFNKETDLMIYKMFCSTPQAKLDKTTVLGVNVLSPQYDPPSIINNLSSRKEFCNPSGIINYRTTGNMYSTAIAGQSLIDHFQDNFNYQIIGDFSKKENRENFEKWWIKNGRDPIESEFKAYDEQFKKLVQVTHENIFDQKSFYNWAVDHLNQSKYLQSSIQENLQFETNFYLQLINRALNKDQVAPLSNKYDYLVNTVSLSKKDNFESINKDKSLNEINKLQQLLNSYYLFIRNNNVNFDQYIAHSKKIDEAINDLLVLAELKKLETSDAAESDDLSAPASTSGTEVSAKNYIDLEVKKPNLRQRIIIAAVKGIHQVESEIRRFIRMNIVLSQSLELDTKEFMADWNNASEGEQKVTTPAKANPFGQSRAK